MWTDSSNIISNIKENKNVYEMSDFISRALSVLLIYRLTPKGCYKEPRR